MRTARLWRGLLGVERTVIEGVEFDEDAGMVAVPGATEPGGAATLRSV